MGGRGGSSTTANSASSETEIASASPATPAPEISTRVNAADYTKSATAAVLITDYNLNAHDARIVDAMCEQALVADIMYRQAMRASDSITESTYIHDAQNIMNQVSRYSSQLNVSAGTASNIMDFITQVYTPRQYR